MFCVCLLLFCFCFLVGGGTLYVHDVLMLLLIKASIDLLSGVFNYTSVLDNIERLHQIQLNLSSFPIYSTPFNCKY